MARAALLCLGAWSSAAAATRPHILLLTTDQQRVDTIAAYGTNPHAVSPRLDALAAQGVRFTQAHAASPVCMPCRTSILTGVHVPVHGVAENGVDTHKFAYGNFEASDACCSHASPVGVRGGWSVMFTPDSR